MQIIMPAPLNLVQSASAMKVSKEIVSRETVQTCDSIIAEGVTALISILVHLENDILYWQ